ncbi:hypothetical protein TSAR_000195 [Trichomalopsis sarcophagae]|uniref:Reelin domain-containing protein n=1 Tax=Trichomalopsis sarcophagae TaxID=543379 RepID=A0A232F6L5_9HYME|nr:hypothetical protein TSAR_000195 [Trichomalopsis sarcophagae]
MSIVSILMVLGLSAIASGFPDGAPVDACVKPRPNQPYHGQARPQPLSTSPYQLIASSDRYQPGSQITGEFSFSTFFAYLLPDFDEDIYIYILTVFSFVFSVRIQGGDFKGFFVQARDAQTNQWIGSWAQTPNTNVHSECSAVTHADPRDKQQATLVWNAPLNARPGTVYFT